MSTLEGHQALWDKIQVRKEKREQERLKAPLPRLWDGDYRLRGVVAGWRSIEYDFIENDTGTATIQLSLDHYLAKWVMNFRGRAKRNVHLTIDKQGYRWSGFMDHYKVVTTKGGDRYLEILFKHDYEQAKHILCWANPFLRPEVQFPKLWVVFGPAKWCLLLTLFVNLLRLETSLWTLPDNPLDITEWMGPSFWPGFWRNIVKPFPLLTDNSNLTFVFSRFKSWYDLAKPILADAQLTVVVRRYIHGEDPHPFHDVAGPLGLDIDAVHKLFELIPIRHGCLVWDIQDKSGWGSGTVFGGSLLVGFVRAVVSIASDGNTEGVDVFTGDPVSPSDYYNPWFLGTNPKMPWVIFDAASPYTGVESSEFTYYEATSTSFVTGGHSMPGVNEAISAGVNMAGDFLTSIINSQLAPLGALGGAIDLPPLGGIMDAVAKILYEDTFLAFDEVPTLRAAGLSLPIAGLEDVVTGLGDFHLYEDWAEGADRANTLSALMAVRAKEWATRARTSHTIKVADACPYYLGEPGYGHCWLGDRVGTTVPEFPIPDTVFVERITKISYKWDQDGSHGHTMEIGYKEPQDPALKALDWVRNINSALSTFGIL
ncbi:Gp37-like protein [Mycobacterium avium]|uniref:Gp37-like protein n=1 Tax=Mycobacterium avium TaxID=1764 RepID=UPI000BAFAEAD|nr:phage tail protein [Mycobacterium avium]PBA69941.1 phage tail protein [Mycobacterium avium]